MKEVGIDCWVVMAREYNEDPVIMSLLPASMLSCRRTTILVFHLDDELKCYSLSRPGTGVGDLYTGIWTNPKDRNWGAIDYKPYSKDDINGVETQFECLGRILSELNPKHIGLNYSDAFAFGDGLSLSLYNNFMNCIHDELKERVISAEKLCIRWLETRTESEIAAYTGIVEIAHSIIEEAFSSKVIIPGVTTNDDVKYYMMQRVIDLNLRPWFDFETSIIRASEGQLSKNTVIMPGDMLHCDVGLEYLGLCTDTQHNGYVLKLDETEPPEGIKQLQRDLNLLQDITIGHFGEHKTGNQILEESLKEAVEKGLTPCIYTHPIGTHGHGAGPTIGLWDMQEGVKDKGDHPLHNNTLYALELNITSSIPEWENQQVTLGAETDILYKDGKVYYIAGRQTRFHLIK